MTSDIKYTLTLLHDFCKENNLNILENYENTKINCNIKLTSKCVNKNCNDFFNKKFHILYKTKVFTCKNCTSNQRLINYKETIMNKYGVKHISQLQEIKDKKVTNCLNKYGVKHINQLQEIKDKIRETNKLNYFKLNNKLPPSLIDQKQVLFDKYGTYNYRSSDYIKNKIKQTVMDRYGVDHISKSKEILDLKRKNSMIKYGVEYPIQHPAFSEKACTSGFRMKEYILPSGKIIKIQGYETFALNHIINVEKINEDDITTGCTNVPTIWYCDNQGKKHRHFVDIFIEPQNRCIEVKSTWTVKKDNVLPKQIAAKELGYKYEIWVYNEKGIMLDKII
jgi:hypothetical protein